jgi:hypothetical protein
MDRTLLASGDQAAAGVLAVLGPALATLLYILNGERILAIAAGAAFLYLLATISAANYTDVPPQVLLWKPAGADEANESVWEDEDDEEEFAGSGERPSAPETPVWELAPPPTAGEALADLQDGLGIAGVSSHALVAFMLLALLAFAGGALAVAEPLYVWLDLSQPPFVLGLLFTATGLGAALASAIVVELRRFGRFFLFLGAVAAGAGLIALPRAANVMSALALVAIIGAANVFAIRGGQMLLLRHYEPAEQRAVAAAHSFFAALMSAGGMVAAILLIRGAPVRQLTLPGLPLGLDTTLALAGASIIAGSALTGLFLALPNRMPSDDEEDEWDDEDEDDWDESAEYSRVSRARHSYTDEHDAYSQEYSAYSAAYETPRRSRRSRYDEDDEEDEDEYSREYRRR